MPVVLVLSQSTSPQAQPASLAEEPLVTVHTVGRLQVLFEAVQTNPVPEPALFELQSFFPHAQLASLATEPSLREQLGNVLHLLTDL